MNWFDTSGITSLAKSALKEAQKTIDKALDIQDDSGEEQENEAPTRDEAKSTPGTSITPQNENSAFFSSWGLTVSAEIPKDEEKQEQPVVTESPSKSHSQNIWGSLAGSFFEQHKADDPDCTIVKPPKAKSMNVIADAAYGSTEDLFSKSQLVMSDANEELKPVKVKDDFAKIDERRGSSRSNRLSLVSSRNSSDSVEVLSQSMKTTPDSEPVSAQSMSHSSSVGQKLNSESVEILPDSLVSPSSIECLGFDSYSSDRNSTPSSNLSPCDGSDKKSTPIGERTERPETAESVSLVADDDDDTMSYNSISECTAPTVLDTDEKTISPFPKTHREIRKTFDKDFIHLEPSISARMHISENSSNDGSWSDRTLNADNDSINLDVPLEGTKKEIDPEDILMEKLSDSSSFYNVNVSNEMLRSESSVFVNVEKQDCSASESVDSSQRDISIKERTSPISSDSKSDLVKIGSDRTSGHTSGDEAETATSSDIEIIPSPNGDGHGFCRSSPAKYGFKPSKFDGTTSPNLVDLVLGKSLATKIRGHNRELSEASIQSNTSDESQGSENERLMRRLCEMAEILEARESRLIEVSRINAELIDSNMELKGQVEVLQTKHEVVDVNVINEDYTQRMSALEKKFQQVIREKDQLRKQLDTLKAESSRKNSSEMDIAMKEKDEMIAQLQEEGEKLARQQLQHSNIIKKLRSKEKDNEAVIKSLRDKIMEQTSDLERIKRSLSAKEELEVSQIEAVYRLTTANKKLELELAETRSNLDDTSQRLESSRQSQEAARRELLELQRTRADLERRRDLQRDAQQQLAARDHQRGLLEHQLLTLRKEMLAEERRWAAREEALRQEVREAREMCAPLGEPGTEDSSAALLQQLAALQRDSLQRDQRAQLRHDLLQRTAAEAEALAAKATEREKSCRAELAATQQRLATAGDLLDEQRAALQRNEDHCHSLAAALAQAKDDIDAKTRELASLKLEKDAEIEELQRKLADAERQLEELRVAERKRSEIMQQEQQSSGGDVSPQASAADSFCNIWRPDDGSITPGTLGRGAPGAITSALGLDDALHALTRRGGELRANQLLLHSLRTERDALATQLAHWRDRHHTHRLVQEQYDALLQMYGEKEEQLQEARLDLHDVTQLYKQQLQELLALRAQLAQR